MSLPQIKVAGSGPVGVLDGWVLHGIQPVAQTLAVSIWWTSICQLIIYICQIIHQGTYADEFGISRRQAAREQTNYDSFWNPPCAYAYTGRPDLG